MWKTKRVALAVIVSAVATLGTTSAAECGYVLEWVGPPGVGCQNPQPAHLPLISPALDPLDMEGDGIPEIVYVNDGTLMVWDGATHDLEWSHPFGGSPVSVAFWGFGDIDGDLTREAVVEVRGTFNPLIQIIDWQSGTVEFTIGGGDPDIWVFTCGMRDTDGDGLPDLIAQVEDHGAGGNYHIEIWGDGPPGTTGIPSAPTMERPALTVAPSPFQNATEIRVLLGHTSQARVDVFDSRGRLVRHLLDDILAAGTHEIEWNGLDDNGDRAAAGLYYFKTIIDGAARGSKVIALR